MKQVKNFIKAIKKDEDYISGKDVHQSVLNVFYDGWSGNDNIMGKFSSYEDMIESAEEINPSLAMLILVGKFNQQVCNGGITQYFCNNYCGKENHNLFKTEELVETILIAPEYTKLRAIIKKITSNLVNEREECSYCYGDGEVEESEKCDECGGIGYVIDEDGEDGEECEHCNGDGYIIEYIECEHCNGDGYVENEDDQVIDDYISDEINTEYYSFNDEMMENLEELAKKIINNMVKENEDVEGMYYK